MTDYLIQTLPPEAGPLLLGLLANWEAARWLLVVILACWVLFVAVLVHGAVRYVRNR